MTYDEALTITTNILEEVKNPDNWTAALFDRVRDAPYYPVERPNNGFVPEGGFIFNHIRKVLPQEDFDLFDVMFCHYVRTGQVINLSAAIQSRSFM